MLRHKERKGVVLLDHLLQAYLIICPLVFLGGFVDSVAGGGGLITLPAYMLAGIPVHMSMGTNKIAASLGGLTATLQYIRSGKINFSIAIPAAIFAFLGGQAGASTAMLLSDDFLNVMMLIVLPVVAIFLTIKKDLGSDEAVPRDISRKEQYLIASLIGFFIGMYDGMVGPGTGTFMIMLFSAFLSLDLITSSGCAKMANMASGVASAVVFIRGGQIMWVVIIPAVACNMLGCFCGSRYAIKGGGKRVRSMIFVVLALLFVKMIYEVLS